MKSKKVMFKFGKSELSESSLSCERTGAKQGKDITCHGVDSTDHASDAMIGRSITFEGKGKVEITLPSTNARVNITNFTFNTDGYCDVENDVVACHVGIPEKKWNALAEK